METRSVHLVRADLSAYRLPFIMLFERLIERLKAAEKSGIEELQLGLLHLIAESLG